MVVSRSWPCSSPCPLALFAAGLGLWLLRALWSPVLPFCAASLLAQTRPPGRLPQTTTPSTTTTTVLVLDPRFILKCCPLGNVSFLPSGLARDNDSRFRLFAFVSCLLFLHAFRSLLFAGARFRLPLLFLFSHLWDDTTAFVRFNPPHSPLWVYRPPCGKLSCPKGRGNSSWIHCDAPVYHDSLRPPLASHTLIFVFSCFCPPSFAFACFRSFLLACVCSCSLLLAFACSCPCLRCAFLFDHGSR